MLRLSRAPCAHVGVSVSSYLNDIQNVWQVTIQKQIAFAEKILQETKITYLDQVLIMLS